MIICSIFLLDVFLFSSALIPHLTPPVTTGYLVNTEYSDKNCNIQTGATYYRLGTCMKINGLYQRPISMGQSNIESQNILNINVYADSQCTQFSYSSYQYFQNTCANGGNTISTMVTEYQDPMLPGYIVSYYDCQKSCMSRDSSLFALAHFTVTTIPPSNPCAMPGNSVYGYCTATGSGRRKGYETGMGYFNHSSASCPFVPTTSTHSLNCDAIPTGGSMIPKTRCLNGAYSNPNALVVTTPGVVNHGYFVQSYFPTISSSASCTEQTPSWRKQYALNVCIPFATGSFMLANYTVDSGSPNDIHIVLLGYQDTSCSIALTSSNTKALVASLFGSNSSALGSDSYSGNRATLSRKPALCSTLTHEGSVFSHSDTIIASDFQNSYFATIDDCQANINAIEVAGFTLNTCYPAQSPLTQGKAASISSCSGWSYSINAYSQYSCDASELSTSFPEPLYSCAYTSTGYILSSCANPTEYDHHDKHHVKIPKNAIYSLLLLLLLLPVILFGVAYYFKYSHYKNYAIGGGADTQPYADQIEEGDMELN